MTLKEQRETSLRLLQTRVQDVHRELLWLIDAQPRTSQQLSLLDEAKTYSNKLIGIIHNLPLEN